MHEGSEVKTNLSSTAAGYRPASTKPFKPPGGFLSAIAYLPIALIAMFVKLKL